MVASVFSHLSLKTTLRKVLPFHILQKKTAPNSRPESQSRDLLPHLFVVQCFSLQQSWQGWGAKPQLLQPLGASCLPQSHSKPQTRPYESHFPDGENEAWRCVSLAWSPAACECHGSARLREGPLPRAALPSTRMVRIQFSCRGSNAGVAVVYTEADAVLYMVVL